ncbi:MAG: hypothetical protein C4525_01880 [Desulfarculus sp.]|jgi:hypothetical protein|nr:MAG: hypothetical protein C4525_01880 [Desulfarculus sp.]
MASVNWEQLLKDMVAAAGDAVHEHGGEVLTCLRSRLQVIAHLAAETHNDYVEGYITKEQYEELHQDLERLRAGAIRVCETYGAAVVQAALNAAIAKLWEVLRGAITAAT